MEATDTVLEKIISCWLASDHKEVVEVAKKLKDVLENKERNIEGCSSALKCSPPYINKREEGKEDIFGLFRIINDDLTWIKACSVFTGKPSKPSPTIQDSLKYGMLVGCKEHGAKYLSDKVYLGVAHLPRGAKYPLHAQDAAEVVHVVQGSAAWGPATTYMTQRKGGDLIYHAAAVPHAVHVTEEEDLLTLFAWTGNIAGKFWYLDVESGKLFDDIIKNTQTKDPSGLYNNMAENYEEIVRGWGYNMPEVVAEKIVELIENPADMKVLDVGCGDGLVGEALFIRGFSDITGMDISPEMLKVAAAKNIYEKLHEVDLMKKLPAESGVFDILSCVGVTTYLSPSAFDEWLRVVKQDGLLVFTTKTGVMETWEEEQCKREDMGQWEKVYKSPPLYYLPTLTDPSKERVYVFVYKKI